MLDQFVVGRVNRISPEAPVPVVELRPRRLPRRRRRQRRAQRAGPRRPRRTGRPHGRRRRAGASPARCSTQRGIGTAGLVVDRDRRTTTKLRIVTTGTSRWRGSTTRPIRRCRARASRRSPIQAEMLAQRAQVIVVSDYLKGAVTATLMARVVAAGRARGIPVLVDPKIPHIDYYARRHAGHAEPPRGGDRDAHAHPDRRGRGRGRRRSSASARRASAC